MACSSSAFCRAGPAEGHAIGRDGEPVWKIFKKNKSVEDFLNKGDFQGALALLEEHLEHERKQDDVNLHKLPVLLGQIADLHLKSDDRVKAAQYFMELADFFDRQGFYKKAVATYKKVLKLEPGNPVLLEKIADFNRRVPKFMVNTQMAQEMKDKSRDIREGKVPEPPSRR